MHTSNLSMLSSITPLWGYLQPILSHEIAHYSLPLPGIYGREALIRPYLDSCPCRKRVNKNILTEQSRCADCQSVRSLATFIPRKDLLSFSASDDVHTLMLNTSRNNSEIVHIRPKGSTLLNDPSSDGLLKVQHDDEILLYWDELGIAASGETVQALVRFRVIHVDSTNNTIDLAKDSIEECGSKQSYRSTDKYKGQGQSDKGDPGIDTDEQIIGAKQDSNNDITHARRISDVKTKLSLTNTKSNAHSSDTEHESTQEESALLTLPMNFFPTSSRSMPYESAHQSNLHAELRSTSPIKKVITSSQTKRQKRDANVKRKYEENRNKASSRTKISITSNFKKEAQNENVPVALSSLTFSQLQQMNKKPTNIDNPQQSKVRNAVLSLTLALKSQASASEYLSLDAYIENEANNKTSMQRTGKWLPRLLQGTDVVIDKQDRDSYAKYQE